MSDSRCTCLSWERPTYKRSTHWSIGHWGSCSLCPQLCLQILVLPVCPFFERCFIGTVAITNIFHPKLYPIPSCWDKAGQILYGQYYSIDEVVDRCATPWRAPFPLIWPFAIRMQIKPSVSQQPSHVLLWQPSPTEPQPCPNRWQQPCTLPVHKAWHCAQGWCLRLAVLKMFFIPSHSKGLRMFSLLFPRQMWSNKEISVPWLLLVHPVSLPMALTSASSFPLTVSALLNQTKLAALWVTWAWESPGLH